MYVSVKVDYAIRALAVLDRAGGARVSSLDIAHAQDLSTTYMRTVLVELGHAQLVTATRGSQAGRQAGYTLARPTAKVTMAELFDAIRLPLTEYSGDLLGESEGPETENVEKVWLALHLAVRRVLERLTVADVIGGTFPSEFLELLSSSAAYG